MKPKNQSEICNRFRDVGLSIPPKLKVGGDWSEKTGNHDVGAALSPIALQY